MSKVLKVIVNIFLVCAILIAAAILVPPIMGVSTTVIDSASTETNLPVGSVTYSQEVSASQLAVGDKVLSEADGRVYAYEIQTTDDGNGTFGVIDTTDSSTGTQEITLRNLVSKIVITVPLIGYVMIAMHSVEGLIIIGLVVLFIIILFILSELWKKPDEEDVEEDEDQIDTDAKILEDQTVDQANDELAQSVAQETKAPAEGEEATEESTDSEGAKATKSDQTETSTDTETTTEEATAKEATDTVAEEATEEVAAETPETEVVEETATVEEEAEPEVEEPEDSDSFVPVERPSAEELLKKAEEAGETPTVTVDKDLGVTILDYSDII